LDSSLSYHLVAARKYGVTKTEIAEILTHIAFCAGWPNAWAAFRLAKEAYIDDSILIEHGFLGQGDPNSEYAQYFTGHSYLMPLINQKETVNTANVTLEPGC